MLQNFMNLLIHRLLLLCYVSWNYNILNTYSVENVYINYAENDVEKSWK